MKPSVLRICLLLLCLSASMAQAWTAQLHLHGSIAAVAGEQLAGPDQTGAAEDGSSCLLCQIASHGSAPPMHYRAPDPAVRTDLSHEGLPPRLAAPAGNAPSHHWLSRGPPRG